MSVIIFVASTTVLKIGKTFFSLRNIMFTEKYKYPLQPMAMLHFSLVRF